MSDRRHRRIRMISREAAWLLAGTTLLLGSGAHASDVADEASPEASATVDGVQLA